MTGIKTTPSARVAGKKGFSLISDEKFQELYAALLQCEMLDRILSQRRASSGYEQWPGREAATAGVVACLRSGDSITPTPRAVLAAYLQNGSLIPSPGNAAATAAQLADASGDALRHKLEKRGNIAVVFAGFAEPQRMREIFTAASRQGLPVFYIIEGTGQLAEVCGVVPVIRVDGSDAVAAYRVAYESIIRAREGGGPTIMECAAWPLDTETDAKAPDPLAKLEHYLADKKLFRRDWKRRLERRFGKALDAAVEGAGAG